MSELLGKLAERFDIADVKQRRQGGIMLDYISIDATIRRLNDVLGASWSTEVVGTPNLVVLADGNFLAVVTISLNALDKSSVGVGADRASDPDKAIKTALAEAIKKAGHQFGIGLYLWEEAERQVIAKQRKAEPQPRASDKTRELVEADTGVGSLGSGSF
jgi:hypothetical protein